LVDLLVSNQEKLHNVELNTLLGNFGLSTEDDDVNFACGDAAPLVLEFIRSADLIVTGTIGRVGIPGSFIGNTAEEVLRVSDSSILAVKPDGHISPLA